MATLSLHEHLCALKEPRFSATDMIKDLIDYLSITLASSGTRRNTHTLCTAVSRSRDLCDKINALISASSNEDGWGSFDTYTVMINPLEKYLLELSEISETSCIASLSGGLLISEWIEAGVMWSKNRKTTTDTLTCLFESEYFKSYTAQGDLDNLSSFRLHDDIAFLDELILQCSARSKGWETRFSPGGWSHLQATFRKFEDIRSKLSTGKECDIIEHFAAFNLTLVGIVEVTVKTSDKETQTRLGSSEVLSKVSAFSTLLETHLDDKTTSRWVLKGQREVQWTMLIDTIQGGNVDSLNFHELKKFPARIRPPYYLQCLALIEYCRILITERAKKIPQPGVEPLGRAIVSVKTALAAAAKLSEGGLVTVKNISVDVLADAWKTQEVDNAVKAAAKALCDSFKEHQIPFSYETLEQAKVIDESRFDDWKTRLQKLRVNAPTSFIEIMVKVTGKASQSLKGQTYKVPQTSSLNMILWNECRSSQQYAELVRKARFETPEQGGTPLSLSRSISEVLGGAPTNKARVVYLILD